MSFRLLALLPALALTLPAFAQSKLLVVLRNGEVRTFELAEVERIEFAGTSLTGGLDPARPVFRDPVGTWDWVDGQTLVLRADSQFALHRSDGTLISQGRWELLESAARRYRLVHARGGYIDTVTLSSDGWMLSGTSNTGYRLEGRRRSDASTGWGGVSEAQIAGTWDWADGRIVVLRTDRTFLVYTANRQTDEGRWEVLDAAARRVRLTHRLAGTADTLVLSADGRTLDGTNNRGARVRGLRR